MSIKDNKEIIMIIVGVILTLTVAGAVIGLPLILIAAYLLNKKAQNPLQDEVNKVNKEIQEKEQLIQQYNEQIGLNQTLTQKRQEIQNIQEKLDTLEAEKTQEIQKKLSNTQEELKNTTQKLTQKQQQLQKIEKQYKITTDLNTRQQQLETLNKELQEKRKQADILDDTIQMQEYGLYTPQYEFTKSEEYKDKLKQIRDQQKTMVKNKQAALCTQEWTIDGSKRKGQAFTNQNLRQAIYTFNIECQQIISNTKPGNINKQKDKILKIYDRINKMNERNAIHINKKYLELKYDELQLSIEYELKKQEEKEILREAREREKEERKIQKELERKEKQIQKQKNKLQQELAEAQRKAEQEAKNEQEKQKLLEQIQALQQQIAKQDQDQQDLENKRTRTGAGFVYIISNIGSFGKGVYKIGVTRRDDPEARVNELSNASVPFKYDVHAFIFSEDAFSLETELHQRFDKQRVNKVNNRKEFFKLTDSDIEQVVKKHKNSTYSFTLEAEAYEYYESMQLEKQQQKII